MFPCLLNVLFNGMVRRVNEKAEGRGVKEDKKFNKYYMQTIQLWWRNQERTSYRLQMNLKENVIGKCENLNKDGRYRDSVCPYFGEPKCA